MKSGLLEKIPRRTGESNLRQRRDVSVFYQLSYIPTPSMYFHRMNHAGAALRILTMETLCTQSTFPGRLTCSLGVPFNAGIKCKVEMVVCCLRSSVVSDGYRRQFRFFVTAYLRRQSIFVNFRLRMCLIFAFHILACKVLRPRARARVCVCVCVCA